MNFRLSRTYTSFTLLFGYNTLYSHIVTE